MTDPMTDENSVPCHDRFDANAERAGKHDKEVALDEAIGTLVGVGRLWAQHGLRVAEMALLTAAETLRTTSNAIGGRANVRQEEVEASGDGEA